jgi:hypothetical protein
MNRRNLLKLSAAGLLLPNHLPAKQAQIKSVGALKKNVVLVTVDLGIFERNFRTTDNKENIYMSRFFADFQKKSTYFDGIYEPIMGGGHACEHAVFTCLEYEKRQRYPERPFISLDHYLADNSLQTTRQHLLYHQVAGGKNISWNNFAQPMPSIKGLEKLHRQLFAKTNLQTDLNDIHRERAIFMMLDKNIKRNWQGKPTEVQLRQAARYQLERLEVKEKWLKVKKPFLKKTFDSSLPHLVNCHENFELVFQALKQKQAQIAVVQFGDNKLIKNLPGVKEGYHTLSHHAYYKERAKQLEIVDSAIFKGLASFLKNLEDNKMLDDTIVLFTCALADANKHTNKSAPAFLFGGDFKHQKAIACVDNKKVIHRTSDLYNSIIKQAGAPSGFAGHHDLIKELF